MNMRPSPPEGSHRVAGKPLAVAVHTRLIVVEISLY
jgi:hypothetical protein